MYAASAQKSLQGLDYITAEGVAAFDILADIVNSLAKAGIPMTRADELSNCLKTIEALSKERLQSAPGPRRNAEETTVRCTP